MGLKKLRWVILTTIVVFYAFIYLATSKQVPLSDFCEKASNTASMFQQSYVVGSNCCSDTSFCVTVKDTTGVDWNALADTACLYLRTQGLTNCRVYVLQYTSIGIDTLANNKCP